MVQEGAASYREQAAGVNQINGAISQVGLVTQRNAAGAEELSSTAEEPASQAEALQDMISFFRVSSVGEHRTGKKRKTEKPHFQDSPGHANHGSPANAGKTNGTYAKAFARIH